LILIFRTGNRYNNDEAVPYFETKNIINYNKFYSKISYKILEMGGPFCHPLKINMLQYVNASKLSNLISCTFRKKYQNRCCSICTRNVFRYLECRYPKQFRSTERMTQHLLVEMHLFVYAVTAVSTLKNLKKKTTIFETYLKLAA